tara:strand:- start:122 stop:862 length:741 start_codon:yes stop_codon:yes gene_type:complete
LRKLLFILFLIINTSSFSQTKTEASKKRTVLQFGLSPSISLSYIRLYTSGVDNNLGISITSKNRGVSGKNNWSVDPKIGLSPTINIPINKSFTVFSNFSFTSFSYDIRTQEPSQYLENDIKQYHIPIQLSHILKLGNSNKYLTSNIRSTVTFHSQATTPSEAYWVTYKSHFFHTTVSESSLKKIIPGISGSLGLRQQNIKGGGFEFGIAASHQINPKVSFTMRETIYAPNTSIVLSDTYKEDNFKF